MARNAKVGGKGHWLFAIGLWRVVRRSEGLRRDMPTACPEMREAVSHWRLVQIMENLRSPKRQPGTDSALPWRPPRLRGEKKAKTQVQLDFIPGLANGQKPMAKLLKTQPPQQFSPSPFFIPPFPLTFASRKIGH